MAPGMRVNEAAKSLETIDFHDVHRMQIAERG
jgi:hypothetical protein